MLAGNGGRQRGGLGDRGRTEREHRPRLRERARVYSPAGTTERGRRDWTPGDGTRTGHRTRDERPHDQPPDAAPTLPARRRLARDIIRLDPPGQYPAASGISTPARLRRTPWEQVTTEVASTDNLIVSSQSAAPGLAANTVATRRQNVAESSRHDPDCGEFAGFADCAGDACPLNHPLHRRLGLRCDGRWGGCFGSRTISE